MLLCRLIDAKLGKKCTLLDLSHRPSVPQSESQGVAVLSCITKGQDPASPPQSPLKSAGSESGEVVEEELKQREAGSEKAEELPAEDSAVKMDLDPPDSVLDENKSTSLKLTMHKFLNALKWM